MGRAGDKLGTLKAIGFASLLSSRANGWELSRELL